MDGAEARRSRPRQRQIAHRSVRAPVTSTPGSIPEIQTTRQLEYRPGGTSLRQGRQPESHTQLFAPLCHRRPQRHTLLRTMSATSNTQLEHRATSRALVAPYALQPPTSPVLPLIAPAVLCCSVCCFDVIAAAGVDVSFADWQPLGRPLRRQSPQLAQRSLVSTRQMHRSHHAPTWRTTSRCGPSWQPEVSQLNTPNPPTALSLSYFGGEVDHAL